MSKLIKLFSEEESGATMVEYGLMVALIAAVCIATVTFIGTNLNSLFGGIANAISTVIP